MSNQGQENARAEVERLRACCQSLEKQLNSVLIGQAKVVRLLITGLLSGGHMLVIGAPGLAKTPDAFGYHGHGDFAKRRNRSEAQPRLSSRTDFRELDSCR